MVLALTVLASGARAQFVWTNPAGGNTGTGANWQGNMPPTSASGAVDVHINSTSFPTAGASISMPVNFNSTLTASRVFARANSVITGSGAVTLNADGSTFTSLEVQGGTFAGSADATLSGLLALTGGTLLGTGEVNANGGVRIATTSNISLRKPIIAQGSSQWESGTIFNSDQRAFTNNGQMTITGGVEWWDTPWTNAGTLTKQGFSISRFRSGGPVFANLGAVNVQQGTLTVDRSTASGHTGDFSVAQDAWLTLFGFVRLNSGASVVGAGTAEFFGGDAAFNSGSTLGVNKLLVSTFGTLTVNSGVIQTANPAVTLLNSSLVAAQPMTLSSLSSTSSTLFANSDVRITGTVQLSGNVSGAGGLTVDGPLLFGTGTLNPGGSLIANGGIQFTSPDLRVLNRPVVMSGASTWSGGPISSNTTFTNDGTWNVSAPQTFSGGSQFVNAGELEKTGTATTTFGIPLVNTGTVAVRSGNLIFQSAPSQSGLFIVDSGGLLRLNGSVNLNAGSRVEGMGTLQTNSGTMVFQSGSTLQVNQVQVETAGITIGAGATVSGNPNLTLTSGAATFNSPSTLGSLVGTSSSVSLNSPVTVSGPVTYQGTISGAAGMDVTGPLTFNGGNINSGGAVRALGGLQLLTGAVKDLKRNVEMSGSSAWSGGQVFGTGGTYTNFGTFDVQGPLTWQGGAWLNNGTLLKTGGSGQASIQDLTGFTNAGTVTVNSGTLQLSASGAHTGRFQPNAGTSLILNGNSSYNTGAAVAGAGTLIFRGGPHNFNGGSQFGTALTQIESAAVNLNSGSVVSGSPAVSLSGGSLTLGANAPQTLASIQSQGGLIAVNTAASIVGPFSLSGSLQGPGTLTIGGLFTFSGGTLNPGGPIIANGGTLFSSAGVKDFKRDLSFGGTTQWQGGQVFGTGSTFSNSGTFEVDGDLTWQGGTWQNNGQFIKTQGAGTASIQDLTSFSNSGTVSVQSGTLSIKATGTHSGPFQSTPGTTLILNGAGTFVTGGSVSGTGQTVFRGGPHNFQSGSNLSAANVSIDASSLNLNAGSSVSGNPAVTMTGGSITLGANAPQTLGSLLAQGGVVAVNTNASVLGAVTIDASLQGPGALSIGGLFTFNGGTLNVGGPITASGGTLFASAASKDIKRNMVFGGTTRWTGGQIFGTGASFTNQGLFQIEGDLAWQGGTWQNQGTLIKTTGANSATLQGLTYFNNSGTVTSQSGWIEVLCPGTHAGVFQSNAGSTIRFGNANTFQSGGTLQGAGRFFLDNSLYQFQTGSRISAETEVRSATLNLNAGSLINSAARFSWFGSTATHQSGAQMTIGGGRIENSNVAMNDALVTTGPFEFHSGSISGTGSLNFQAGVQFISPNIKTSSRGFTMGGTSTWEDGTIVIENNQISRNNGTFNISGGVAWNGGIFDNRGTVNKTTNATSRVAQVGPTAGTGGAQFSNAGTVNVQAGTLAVGGWGSHSGQFNVSPGATLTLDSPHTFRSGARVTSNGLTRWTSGITNFRSGSTFSGNLQITGGAVNFQSGSVATLPSTLNLTLGGSLALDTGGLFSFQTLQLANTVLTGNDAIEVSGSFRQLSGVLSGTGTFTVKSGATATWDLEGTASVGRPVRIVGTGELVGGDVQGQGSSLQIDGTLNVNDGASWSGGALQLNGTIRKSTGTGTAEVGFDSILGQGVIEAEQGVLSVRGFGNRVAHGNGTLRSIEGGAVRLKDVTSSLEQNTARIELVGIGATLQNASGQSALRFLNNNSGILNVQGGAQLDLFAPFQNRGTFTVDAESAVVMASPLSQTAGTLRVDGSLSTPQLSITGGTVEGNGAVIAPIVNSSVINPGVGIGTLALQNGYTQNAIGRLVIDVSGTQAGNNDQLLVNGNVVLGGALDVQAPSSVFIPVGTRYRVMQWTGNRTGVFSVVPAMSEWTVEYLPQGVDLVRVGSTNTVTIFGTVVLSNIDPQNGVPPVQIEMRQGSTVVQSQMVLPTSDGLWAYQFQTSQQGPFTLYAVSGGYLRQARAVTITSTGATNVNFSLTAGDADMSGEVDAADIDRVITSFGTAPGDPDYIANTDLDRSGEVDAADIDIVISHFGMVGD